MNQLYSELQGNGIPDPTPPRLEMEGYWKGIWEKDRTHNNNFYWLVDHWTSQRPELIHAYWLKKLTALQEHLAAQMNLLAYKWTAIRPCQTVLISKNTQKRPLPSNYRPITWFSITWKLLSAIISVKMNKHTAWFNTRVEHRKEVAGVKQQSS